MNLKQIIKRQRILQSGVIDLELDLPGEPMIYSIKYPIGNSTRSVQFFRNMKWASLLKSYFRSFQRTNTPVVVIVKFYVSPFESAHISDKDLKKESMPAVQSFELCDYLLSFLEMIHHVLINCYRQIVKVEMVKLYSNNPRTVFKFMKWDEYVYLQNNNSVQSKGKGIRKSKQVTPLQPELQGDASNEGVCEELPATTLSCSDSLKRAASCDSPFQDSGAQESPWQKTRTAKLAPTHKKARR